MTLSFTEVFKVTLTQNLETLSAWEFTGSFLVFVCSFVCLTGKGISEKAARFS